MFLKEFKNNSIRDNFINLVGVISGEMDNYQILLNLVLESGFSIDDMDDKIEKIRNEVSEILAFKDNDSEFEEELMELIEGADFKFYIEYLMIWTLIKSDLSLKVKGFIERSLNLDEEL